MHNEVTKLISEIFPQTINNSKIPGERLEIGFGVNHK